MGERYLALIFFAVAFLIGIEIGNNVLRHEDATAIMRAIREANPHG